MRSLLLNASLAGCLTLACSSSTVFAASNTGSELTEKEQQVANEIEASLQTSDAPVMSDPEREVKDLIERFMASKTGRALNQRMARGELYVGYATDEVAVDPNHKQWGKFRSMAYEKALIKAENNYLAAQGLEITSEKVRSLFNDASGEVPDFDDSDLKSDSKFGQLLDKLVAFASGTLDKELEELGIDPAEYNSLPPAQKHVMLSDHIQKDTVKKAVGKLSGVVPYKTFEAKNEAGNHVIGVIIVASPKMRQFAHDVIHSGGDIAPNPDAAGVPIYDQVKANSADLFNRFGIRKLVDEEGYPVLISYGQWANGYRGNDGRKQRRQREMAEIQARSLADSQIAFFVAGKANYTDSSTIGALVEDSDTVDQENFHTQETVNRVIDTVRQDTKAKAKAKLTGLIDLYTWSQPHPLYADQELVGVVRVWSPVMDQAMNQVKDWKANKQKASKAAAANAAGSSQSWESDNSMDAADF